MPEEDKCIGAKPTLVLGTAVGVYVLLMQI